MDSLESRLRKALQPLGYRVDKTADGYALKSASGNLIVKGCSGLSLEQLEIRVNDIVGGKPMPFVPLPHSATAKALKLLNRKH